MVSSNIGHKSKAEKLITDQKLNERSNDKVKVKWETGIVVIGKFSVVITVLHNLSWRKLELNNRVMIFYRISESKKSGQF